MKLFKSIKWRLQIWYGLILVLVLVGFGFTAYQLEKNRLIRSVDDGLHRRVDILAKTLHSPPRGKSDRNIFDRRPPEQVFSGQPDRKFNLPTEATALFGTNDVHNFYFIIEGRDGEEIAQSHNVSQSEADFQHRFNARLDAELDNLPVPHASLSSQDNRAILQRLPSGETIYVGCSVMLESQELKLTAIKFVGIGAVILIFGLLVGHWLVSRAIRPIDSISDAAAKISAGDLSQRINVAETESELGQLAAVLNSTFVRLESAFAQQKQFASDAAHELRTPISVILTQTQTALNRKREAADYCQTIEACQRAAQRMRKLISSLLELARLDAGQEPMKRQRFDFSKIVANCVEEIRPLADERGVKIISDLPPLEISGDAERLTQVVTNLLTNAIQYNHDGGEARVKLESQNGLVILTVSDNGVGIPPEDLPRVFERFYRADKSRSGANAGLGLAISKAIVAAHGGTIEVSSEENTGTTFIIWLPA